MSLILLLGNIGVSMTDSKRPVSNGLLYYRHSLTLRVTHWINAFVLAVLLMSGLNIFNAHPALYWGKSSYTGAPPVLELGAVKTAAGELKGVTRVFGRKFYTTGFLGASGGRKEGVEVRGFPSWLTIPGESWLSLARRWHFFFGWLLVLNGTVFMVYTIASGHLRRELLPTREDWRSMGKTIVDHLCLRRPKGEEARRYNVLQKLAYLSVTLLLVPMAILMGLGMSPALDSLFPGWVDIFGGRQSIRTFHFIISWALVLFTIVHVLQVIVHGFWNNLRSMITGHYRIEPEADHE